MNMDQKGAYTPPPEPEESFDARTEGKGRGPLLLAIASLVLLLFSVLIWFTYRQGTRERSGDTPPRLLADQKPYKTAPRAPSSSDTAETDKTVYDMWDGEPKEAKAAPSPSPEQPLEKPRQTVQITPKNTPESAESKTPPQKPSKLKETPKAEPKTPPETVQPQQAQVKKPVVSKPAKPLPAKQATKTESGSWLVQVAAHRSKSAAEADWKTLTKTHAGILKGKQASILRADLGQKGVFYRLRIAGYPDRQAAQQACSSLKKKGRNCLITRK